MSFFGSTSSLPKKKKSLGNINEDQVNSSDQTQPVTYFAGRRYVAGQFLSPGYNEVIRNVEGTTGKGEQGTVAHVYYCDFGILLAVAGRMPVRGIYKIIEEAEIIWKNDAGVLRGTPQSEDITVDKRGQARIYWGSETQTIDDLVFTTRGVVPIDPDFDPHDKSTWARDDSAGIDDPLEGHYDQHSAYRGQCYIVHKKWKLGRERGQIPNMQYELIRDVPWFSASSLDRTGNGFVSDARGVNPAGVIFDFVTDIRTGRGYSETLLNMAKWEATAQALAGAGLRISPLIASQEDFRTVVTNTLECFDGYLRFSGGLLELGYFGHGAINLGALPQMTDDDLLGEPDIKPSTYSDAFTQLTINISDRAHHYQTRPGAKYDNPSMRRIIGQAEPMGLDREWVTDQGVAKIIAAEEGHIRSLPKSSGTLSVKREWLDTAKDGSSNIIGAQHGDRFMWNSASRGYSFCYRINKTRRLRDSSGEVELTVENERSVWPRRYVPPDNDDGGDFHVSPVPVINKIAITLPYGLRVNPARIEMAIMAQRPRAEMRRFHVWFSPDDAVYNMVSSGNQFAVRGELTADCTQTSNAYDDILCRLYGPGLEEMVSQTDPQREDNNLLLFIDYRFGTFPSIPEVMSVGQIVAIGGGAYQCHVKRALYGTSNAFHPGPLSVGGPAPIWLIFRNRLTPISSLNFTPGPDNYFKLQTYTAIDELDIADDTAIAWEYLPGASHSLPSINPGTSSFTGSLTLTPVFEPGMIVRFDGTRPTAQSPEWPKSGGAYTTMAITNSRTIWLRGYLSDGSSTDPVGPFVYTEVASGAAGSKVAGRVLFGYSGRRGQTAGNLTISGISGATIHYAKNGGAYATYTGPLALVVGDYVDAYQSATGYADSDPVRFDNGAQGGGYDPPAGGGYGSRSTVPQ